MQSGPIVDFLLDRIDEDESPETAAVCREKRRLIAEALDDVDGMGGFTLRVLSLPYSAHPDFDPRWLI